jgi:hypothetical protein
MEEKKKDTKEQQPIILPYGVKEEKKVVCDLCGYANPEHTAICQMCSNYLDRR